MSKKDIKKAAQQQAQAREAETVAAQAREAETAAAQADAMEAREPEAAAEAEAAEGAQNVPQDSPAPKKKKTGLIIGLAAALAAVGAGGYWYYAGALKGASAAPEETVSRIAPMPDLMYETGDVAQKALMELGVDADVLFVPSGKVPSGLVTLQSVSAGQPVKPGQKEVIIYVSMGPAPTPTPEPSPLPTPTPRPTPKARPQEIPEIVVPVPSDDSCHSG